MQPVLTNDSFANRIRDYANTAEWNDRLHREFNQQVQAMPLLANHRQHIEAHQLGFGDPAFHYLWYLLIQQVATQFDRPNLLEIGVFKGQVISLWALLAKHLGLDLSITGITPLEGNPLPESTWLRRMKKVLSQKFRQDREAGNFYPDDDYLAIIADLFSRFDLDFAQVRLIHGYSNHPEVLASLQHETFSLIYIDGDHSFEGATADIQNYHSRIAPGGFLVMDDASFYLPGTGFWKGHETVSRACECIPALGFVNVLNIGHNRVYQKVG